MYVFAHTHSPSSEIPQILFYSFSVIHLYKTINDKLLTKGSFIFFLKYCPTISIEMSALN